MTAQTGPVEVYIGGFLARGEALRGPGQSRIDEVGLHGVFSSEDPSSTRLLVDDDHAMQALPQLLAFKPGGKVNVLATAPRAAELLHRDDCWRGKAATAMVMQDLRTDPGAALPSDLNVRPVRRSGSDPPGGLPLVEAVACAVRADQSDDSVTIESLSAHLQVLPPSVRLFAAVDIVGSVVGTAGVGVFGRYAHVVFVNTDIDRRGEGIGRAMTALALADARARGADAVYLDASSDGKRLYDAMGFETAAALTRFTYLT